MDRMTIVYINGFEEKYQVQNYNPVETYFFDLNSRQKMPRSGTIWTHSFLYYLQNIRIIY